MHPKLGQHFLTSPALAEKIVRLSGVGSLDTILEVGPGRGILTRPLARVVQRVIAIEKDRVLVSRLRNECADLPNVEVIEGDILEVERSQLEGWARGRAMKMVSNLPYQIATEVVFRLMEWRPLIPEATVMLQKEVADRLVAGPGGKNYGVPTVLLGLVAKARIVLKVSPGSFFPPPKVNSALVCLEFFTKPLYDVGGDPKKYEGWVRAAFSKRRKTLANNLLGKGLTRDEVKRHLEACGLPLSVRAESLAVADFAGLVRSLESG